MYEFPPFRLDPTNQSLLRLEGAEKPVRIHLAPKAYSILHHLVENAERLVTHSELIEKIWPDTYVQPEVVASHIRDIRAALEDDARKPKFIETLSRRGYRFIGKTVSSSPVFVQHRDGIRDRRLVGRDAALAQLTQSYRSCCDGRRELVFIVGEQGIGKTALCLEFIRRLEATQQSPYIAWGQCIEGYGGEAPYYPMIKAVADLCARTGEAVVNVLVAKAPTCIVQFSDLVTREQRLILEREVRGATTERMLRELFQALQEVSLIRPLVVVLDDLQWVDGATLDVISAFARGRESARVLIIATFRPLDAVLNKNPVQTLKQELLAQRLCSEIGLHRLTQTDVTDYVQVAYPRSDSTTELATLLYRRSEGNPLFMTAALEHSVAQGLLIEDQGQIHPTIPLSQVELELPQSLSRVVEAQIERLSTEEQTILESASVAGVTFSPAIIAPAADSEVQHVEDLCHHLARRMHVIRSSGTELLASGAISSRYEFVHALYREVLYERQAPGRRAIRHQRVGEALDKLHKTQAGEAAAELAYHFECAGDWFRAVQHLSTAAEVSERRYRHREAASFLLHANELAERIPKESRSRLESKILQQLSNVSCVSRGIEDPGIKQ